MIPPEYQDLLTAPNTAVFVTLGSDGSPHASPVWFLFDGEHVKVSTVAGRQKHRNLERDPRVTLTVVDPASPLRYVEIRGTATLADDPSKADRDAVAHKHGFPDGAAFDAPDARRVTATITAGRVIGR